MIRATLIAGVLAGSVAFTNAETAPRPNLVVILSDDAGFEEFGLYGVNPGKPSNTPNIDRLGERGVAFAHCWAQAICAPSRAMFLTGALATGADPGDLALFAVTLVASSPDFAVLR